MEFLSKSVEETAKIANDFAKQIADLPEDAHQGKTMATIVGLYGDLGAGKTTFMKYFAKALGVNEEIKSPTFVIMRRYHLTRHWRVLPLHIMERVDSQSERGEVATLIHIDAYRIENSIEMLNLGWNEIIADPKNLICIEWPEKIAEIMPAHIMLKFEHVQNENQRKITIS
jgi:tRNA threonylcarbamoyladenosine biosynthesis protein TsaE